MLFDNPVEKVAAMLAAMRRLQVVPECECFDTGIVRSIAMFQSTGMLAKVLPPAHNIVSLLQPYSVSLVMGVASGMPANPAWLPLLVDELPAAAKCDTCM